MCPHIPITVRAQFRWIQQQHVSVDPYVRRKPKVDTQPPEIKQKVLQNVFCLQSSLTESYLSCPPHQIQHKSEFTQSAWTSLTSADSVRPVYFRFNFYVSAFAINQSSQGKHFSRVLSLSVLLLKMHLNSFLTKTLLSWGR